MLIFERNDDLFNVFGAKMTEQGFSQAIHKRIKTPFFSEEDLKLANPDLTLTAIHNALSYSLKTKKIIKIKRGHYCLNSDDGKIHFSKNQLANSLYSPSYLSFESALSFYRLIPEAVYETTSACFQKKNREYETPYGIFSYAHIPVRPFFLDVVKDQDNNLLIASALRALFDLIYLRRKRYTSLEDLDNDLRVDLDELATFVKSYTAEEIETLGELYKKESTRKLAHILIRGLK